MTPFLQFKPIYQERVWGGRLIESFLGRKLLGAAPIGESWEIVDRSEAQSVIINGPWAGRSLHNVMCEFTEKIMGPAWSPERPFPILVKWLDCRDRLSVQVHPPPRSLLSSVVNQKQRIGISREPIRGQQSTRVSGPGSPELILKGQSAPGRSINVLIAGP